jgi:hypothetical protein
MDNVCDVSEKLPSILKIEAAGASEASPALSNLQDADTQGHKNVKVMDSQIILNRQTPWP